MRYNGVHVALVTPFRSDGELDIDAYRSHVVRLAAAGVAGFVPCGTTGESAVLEDSERDRLLEATVDVAKTKGILVLAGCGSSSTRVSIAQVRRAREMGCDAALVVTPYYNRPTQAGLIQHYLSLADASDLPILLYNVPGRTGVNLSVESTRKLLAHPRIAGIKEASGNHSHWLELSSAVDWRERSWLAGDDDAFATTLSLGGSGIISATANWIPELFVAIGKLFSDGNVQGAFELQRSINPIVRAAFVESSPGPIKYGLRLMGSMSETLRLPLVPPGPASIEMIRSALHGASLI